MISAGVFYYSEFLIHYIHLVLFSYSPESEVTRTNSSLSVHIYSVQCTGKSVHMAGFLSGELVQNGTSDGSSCKSSTSTDKQEEQGRWYMTRKEIEEYSPSRRDGIDLKKETYLRKSYCTFLQDLGMRLKV